MLRRQVRFKAKVGFVHVGFGVVLDSTVSMRISIWTKQMSERLLDFSSQKTYVTGICWGLVCLYIHTT